MATEVRVRIARGEDGAAVAALTRDFARELGCACDRVDPDWLAGLLAGGTAFAVIAETRVRPLAYALCAHLPSTFSSRMRLHLEDLYVVAEARRTGLARRLLAAVGAHAEALGVAEVSWTARARDRAALAFYGRIGAVRSDDIGHSMAAARLRGLAIDEG